MANCNCNDFPISCAPHAPGGDCCHPHGCPPHPHPCPPPPFKGGTSMYIGARYVPIFADPVEWDDEREYEPLTIVTHNGDCYTSKCYVPKGAQLPPYPEGQTKYWVKTSDYNGQFADLKKTLLDLSRLVEQFQKDNKDFTDLINGWNEKVQQWENEMTAWGERLDTVESHITDLTASLNAEIDRAKAAEQANAAAIAKETTDRQQAISELDAAYKAADTALSDRITANKTDIDALKAEQAIQNTNISANAKNISDNAAEIAKHAARLTDLESNASDWDSVFPDTTIAQEVQKEEAARANGDTALNGRCDAIAADVEEVRDIANHKVDTAVYTAGQAAQDAKIAANTAALAGKADKGEIPDASGFVTTETYTQGQAAQDAKIDEAKTAADKANANIGNWETDHPDKTISQCATSLENETAANAAKADANAAIIGDWNAEHPGKTIAQEVTRLNGAIPDVSGFVTETTYNQGQAAQDSKITAAQTAANKANTNIGNWDAQHPGKTIAQAVTDAGYLDFLNDLYPQGSVVPGGSFYKFNVFSSYYKGSTTTSSISFPVFVPDIVARFSQCWTPNYIFPTSIILHDAAGNSVSTSSVINAEILSASDTPYLYIELSSRFNFPVSGIYYFEFSPDIYFGYSWTKNATPFPSLK